MKAKTGSKLATALMVLLMVLSAAMVLQWNASAEEENLGSVEGIIDAQPGITPKGYNVIIKDLYRDKMFNTSTQEGGYFQFSNLGVGNYKLILESQYHKNLAFLEKTTGTITVSEGANDVGFISVETRDLDLTLKGNVTDSDGEPINDATVTLTDSDRYTVSEKTGTKKVGEKDVGNETVNITYEGFFELPIYTMDNNGDPVHFDIKVKAPGYAPNLSYDYNLSDLDTFNATHFNFSLTETPVVSGYLWSEDGDKAVTTGMEVTLYNETLGVFHNTMPEGNPFFKVGATVGEFILVVDPVGYLPYVDQIQIQNSDEYKNLGKKTVKESGEEKTDITIDFDGWNNLNVTRERTIRADTRLEGLDYSYLGNLRMQIDLALGNGDTTLTQNEVDDFKDWLEWREANITSTQGFVDVDGTYYDMVDYTYEKSTLDALVGDVTDVFPDEIIVNSSINYQSDEELSDTNHLLNLDLMNDHTYGNLRNYSYTVNLTAGYERVESEKESVPPGVDLSGYTSLEIDPSEGEGTSHIVLDIRTSEKGEASITLQESASVYRKRNTTYIVKEGTNVSCEAQFTDPVSDEEGVNYSWLIDDSSIGKYGEEITHIFDNEGTLDLSVEIVETGGQVTEANLTIIVDGSGPSGEITVDNSTVEEGQSVQFSAFGFTDEGVIIDYEWNFSDGSDIAREMNVTHTFELKGSYEVELNITDIVGNWNVETVNITVEDTTKPVAKFLLKFDDKEKESQNITTVSVERRQKFTLDASPSYDPAGYDGEKGAVDVKWSMEDIDLISQSEQVEDFSIEEIGTYTLYLNVTDVSGNYQNISKSVEVTPGPTPNLEVKNVTLSSDNVKVGEKVTVTINITNYGTAAANGTSIVFKVNGEVEAISPEYFKTEDEKANTTSIPDGEYRLIKFSWEPNNKGDKELTLNVTDNEEPNEWFYDNEMTISTNVNPPAWRKYLGYILIPVVIIGVTVSLYFYKDKIQEKLGWQ